MPKNIIQYDLLISCPGDITSEIDIIEDTVIQFNTQFSDALGISIRTKRWQKNSYAQSGGKPQELLNEQFVNDCDAAVALLWTRFGTPTDKYGSGTEEEVELMLSSGKQVFMYFSDKPISPSQMNEDGYKKVQAFREKYKDRGIYFTYSSDEEFKKLFFAHLSQHFLSEKRIAEVKEKRHSELRIIGIDQNGKINKDAQILEFVPDVNMTTDQYLERIHNLFNDISAIKLDKRVELSGALSTLALSFSKPVEISEDNCKIIRSVAEKLDINITDDFFVLGNLSQSGISHMAGGISISGTKEEKKKYYSINNLLEVISEALEWIPVEKAFSKKNCIKLALQNIGTDIDEDIEISLRIPETCLLSLDEFPPLRNKEMGYLLNDCNMDEMFGICSTSEYLDYNSSTVIRHFSPHKFKSPLLPGYTPEYSDDFKRELANVFCYSFFKEANEYIVKLHIDYIKHNTTIAFPSVIFVKNTFNNLPYTITSKNTPEIISGEIVVTDITQSV